MLVSCMLYEQARYVQVSYYNLNTSSKEVTARVTIARREHERELKTLKEAYSERIRIQLVCKENIKNNQSYRLLL